MQTCHVVVARYEEDISWVRKLSLTVFVYNKGDNETGLESEYSVMRLPNVGHESHTFVHHIVEHYDNLPEKLVLLQGDPFDHCAGLLSILSEVDSKNVLTPLSQNWKRESLAMEYNWEGFTPMLREMAAQLDLFPEAVINYGAGAQYIVQRSDILKRPKAYYQMLIERLAREKHPLEGWVLERLWPYVFGATNKTDKLLVSIISDESESADSMSTLSTPYLDFNFARRTADFDFARYVAQETQDFVFVFQHRPMTDMQYYTEAINAFKKEKFSRPTESDPILIDEKNGVFMTHRYVLLQHMSAFNNGQLNYDVLQARGVPVLMVSG